MMMGIVLLLCMGAGSFYFGHFLQAQHGESSVITKGLKGVAVLLFIAAGIQAVVMWTRGVSFSIPSLGSLFRGPLQTTAQVQAQCSDSVSAFRVTANETSYCECEVRAFEAGRAADSNFNPTRTHYVGTPEGEAAFRAEFGRCALPRIRGWLSSECTTGCSAQAADYPTQSQQHQLQMGCSRICRCVVSNGLSGQSAEDVANLIWGSGTGDAARGGFEALFQRGMAQCESQAR